MNTSPVVLITVVAREVDGVMRVEAVPEPEQPDEFWASHQHG